MQQLNQQLVHLPFLS